MNINQIALEATEAEFKVVVIDQFNSKVVVARGAYGDCADIVAVTKPELKARMVRNELFGLTVEQAKQALFNI